MKRFFFFRSGSLPVQCLCPCVKKKETEDDQQRKNYGFSYFKHVCPVVIFLSVFECFHSVLILLVTVLFYLFHFFPSLLVFSSFFCSPLGSQPCALEALRN
ncbi:hypothetical protein ILYODFUR_001339 [Ilyodon furcidens]|uniref:Uncharacterized protein n=1 Tax=Ilyodon furcidens TaxID=33524 RepID=A0ABV0VA52_9TELE